MPITGTDIDASHLAILREIRQPILTALNRSFRNAYVAVVDGLIERIVEETNWEKQDQLNVALDILRNGKASIEQQFEVGCARSWKERTGVASDGSYSTPQTTIIQDEPPTLRLVDDDTMRDQLLVARISARARRRMDEELADGLRARFGALLQQDWFAENEYPIAPDIIFEVLRGILTQHQVRPGDGTASFLLDLFEPKFTVELIELYQDVNRRLIAYGILPELRYSISKSRASQYVSGEHDDAPGEGAEHDEHGGRGNGRGGRANGHGVIDVSEAEIGQWADQIGSGSEQSPAMLAQATRYLADPRNFGNDAQMAAHKQATSDQLMAVLSELQARTEEANSPEAVGAVMQEVRQQSSAAAQTHGSPLDRLIIETVAQVFQLVYEDDAIANAIKQQLLRLQVAAFKAALLDASFFARPDHPMRRFVDRLAQMGSDPDFETEPGSPLVEDIEDLVTWVLNNFERELVVIGEALDRAERIIADETARRDARLEKIAEAASRAERIDLLRQEIRDGMRARLTNGQIPECIQHFAEHSWTEVIVRLRDGTGELPFDEARAQRVLETLLWSVQPKKATEISELARTLPQMIADLSRGMAFIAMPGTEREAFLKTLMACHGQVIQQSKNRPVTPVACPNTAAPAARTAGAAGQGMPAGQGAPATNGQGMSALAALAKNAAKQPVPSQQTAGKNAANTDDYDPAWDEITRAGLKNGDEIERDHEGETRRYKLGWVSPSATVFIFSRYPREHWTVNRRELHDLMARKQVRVIRKTAPVAAAIDALQAA